MTFQYGLEWGQYLLGSRPRWAVEPQLDIIEQICRQKLNQPHTLTVEFFGQGAFNKLYTVQCETGKYMMRVSLPMDPRYKTLSEVATLAFVRQNTNMPVPKVVTCDTSNDNGLGFEGILMDLMPGKVLGDCWTTMSWTAKEELVKHVVFLTAEMSRKRFNTIGNLYYAQEGRNGDDVSGSSADGDRFRVGRIVSKQFFWDDHLRQDVPKGPFRSRQGKTGYLHD